MHRMNALLIAGIGYVLAEAAPPALAQEVSYENLVAPLVSTSKTVVGETLVYPTDAPAKVTAVLVTVPPGGETGWHRHPVPLFGYILEGTLVVDYGEHGRRTYNPGEALLEAMAAAHNGTNPGSTPVRILAVYIGAEGHPNAAAAEPAIHP